ncbi:MAG: hypothetical protein IPP42_02000 [Saprospiraceae bacterium]|nr:hypothetical protein [Saprospiraceae bacterium]
MTKTDVLADYNNYIQPKSIKTGTLADYKITLDGSYRQKRRAAYSKTLLSIYTIQARGHLWKKENRQDLLVRKYFDHKIRFEVSGLYRGNMSDQLAHFPRPWREQVLHQLL